MSWEEARLRDYIITLKGFAFKSEDYQEKGIPIVRVSDFTDNSVSNEKLEYLDIDFLKKYEKYSLKFKDILIQTVGSWQNNPASVVGKVVRVPNELNNSLLNQNAVKIISKDINYDFLYYLLKSNYFKEYILSTAQGAANQASITLESIGKFKFKLPSLNIQNKIANILSNYDNLIENNNKRIKLLENMAEELYKEWFVRLRFPNYQNTKIIDGIPDGWEKKKLGDIFNTSSGGTPSRKNEQYFIGNIPWIKTGELKDIFVLDTEEHISDEALNNSSAKLFQENTIIIAMYCAMPYLSILLKPSSTNQACCAFLPKQEYLDYSFIYFFIKNVQQGLILHAHGAAQQNLSQEIISNYESILPFKELIVQYSEIAKPLFEKIKILMIKNQNLKETRDLLLPRLISGKLDIKNLDIV